MKLTQMPKEELQLLSYTDLTYRILKENKKTMNTPSIFKIICDLLEYSEEDYESRIGDYYTSLTIDKRFVLLENADWDLRENHSIDLAVEEEEEESVEEEDLEKEEEDVEDDDDLEEDPLDLNIVEEDDLEDM